MGWIETALPYGMAAPFLALPPRPWADLLIGSGRRAAPVLRRIKARQDCFTVFLGNPRVEPRHFDLVVAPAHDDISGNNVIPILGSLHRVTPQRLEEASLIWAGQAARLPKRRVAVLVGGTSKRHHMPEPVAHRLVSDLKQLADQGIGLMITLSRRTPDHARTLFQRELGLHPAVWLYDGIGDNPYFGFLALSDAIIVTNDSVNMASEACAAGKPVLVFDLPGRDGKLARFHRDLTALGLTRPFLGTFSLWQPAPFNETKRIVEIIRDRLADPNRSPYL
jgi:mitochondrial fission protein ELM1